MPAHPPALAATAEPHGPPCLAQQLYAEIQIHKAVSQGGNSHVNVLNFLDWFEDRDNVYMMVELCHKGVRVCTSLSPCYPTRYPRPLG